MQGPEEGHGVCEVGVEEGLGEVQGHGQHRDEPAMRRVGGCINRSVGGRV